MPSLYRVILPVTNLAQAVKFYSHVLGIKGTQVSPGRHYFPCGPCILACFDSMLENNVVTPPNPEYIYIAVSDLEQTSTRVHDAGAAITHPIRTMPWGERIFYFKDPFNNPVAFVDEKTIFTGGQFFT